MPERRPGAIASRMEAAIGEIGWSQCDAMALVRGRCSGAWVVKHSRILADGIIENFEVGATPEENGEEIYDSPGSEHARRIISYARTHGPHAQPHA